MGDHGQYREIMHKLFIDGEDPADIWWTDSEGKSHRLTEPQKKSVRGRPSKDQFEQLAEMKKRAAELAAAKKSESETAQQVASVGDD